ncbi:hypothetical protein D3C81_1472390 [compost metagenome]
MHLEAVGNARRVAQPLEHFRQQLRLALPGFQFEVVPLALHHQLGIEVPQHGANVLRQLPDELPAYRTALDGDFGEGFDNDFHDGRTGTAKREKGDRL